MADTKGIRLNKYLAECGVCSRREADRLIEEGRVTVSGKIPEMGYVVMGNPEILVNGKPVNKPSSKVVLAYYKPVGVTCTEKDPHADKTILQSLGYKDRVTYAGRLDKDSEGLILMTNDGDLIHAMMQGSACHEKEYVVRIDKEVNDDFIRAMSEGVYIKELSQKTRKCVVVKEGKYTFRIVLTQGLNRQIRRMCKTLGRNVVKLKRERVLNIKIGDLKPGAYRVIEGDELTELYSCMKERM